MKKILGFLRDNCIPLLFVVAAAVMELVAVTVTSGSFYIRDPWMYLTVLAVLCAVLFLLPTNRARHICACCFLVAFFVIDIALIIIYEMTGSLFDFSLFSLRGDAMAILESVPVNFAYTFTAGMIISAFIVFGRIGGERKRERTAAGTKIAATALALALVLHIFAIYGIAESGNEDKYLQNKIYEQSANGYSNRGVVGTCVSELYEGAFNRVEVGSKQEIRDYIYSEVNSDTSPNFGAADGYNVVTVLCETFEWFSFIKDLEEYPYGHTASEEVLRQLYPNLYEFYDTSLVMTNFHAREKTDISENLSLFGSYPLDYYTNYNYDDVNIEHSLPNIMETLYGIESISFHNGLTDFYNRYDYLRDAVGFKKFVATEHMVGEHMTDYYDDGMRNLDSEMIAACEDEMFPTDKRFNTYILTITMHGRFSYRENLDKYYAKMDALGVCPLTSDENANAFRHYAAAAMEFDAFVGALMDTLKKRGLDDNTVVVLFGDHNAYYQGLSSYVKDIYPVTGVDDDICELYRVPMMMRIGNQVNSRTVIDKFTCTADILPTLMSVLGIRYFSNLYYGRSIFESEESVLYSRAYDLFMTDKVHFTTLDNITYREKEADELYMKAVEEKAKVLMKKVSFTNRIFAADFFRGKDLELFRNNMRAINSIQ